MLPDHLHCIWTLPEGDANYSTRWAWIKKEFSKQARHSVGAAHPTPSMMVKRESGIWQRRFWEHRIRDDKDFQNHCDYIHYNPVKHGLTQSPSEWPYSTFHRFVENGIYATDWGSTPIPLPESTGKE